MQYESLQADLSELNRLRLCPGEPVGDARAQLDREHALRVREHEFLAGEIASVHARAAAAPRDPGGFVAWFEDLRETGPGQGDPLFPWLAERAEPGELVWFLKQEVSGEAGFEDLVALTQLRMPERAKLELARNYWDEMGRGNARGMHGPMLARLADEVHLTDVNVPIVWESLALGNLLAGFAANRRYAYHSIGALGAVELTAPGRAALVNAGLKRAGVAPHARQYYALHATLDIKHSEAWDAEVLTSIVEEKPEAAPWIAEGALARLAAGARCFERYRRELGVGQLRAA